GRTRWHSRLQVQSCSFTGLIPSITSPHAFNSLLQGMDERLSASTSEAQPGSYVFAVDPAIHAQLPTAIGDVQDSGADHVRLVGLSQRSLLDAVSCCQSPETYGTPLEPLVQQHEQRPVTSLEAPGVN